jgi:phasin family protein
MARKNNTTFNFDPMNVFASFDPAKTGEQFTKMFGEFAAPKVDMDAFMAAQRKSLEVMTAANQAAFDGVRAIAERQADMVRESVEATAGAVEAMRTVKEPKDAMEKQADFARTAFDKAVKDSDELRELAVKTGNDVAAPISAHISASMDELSAMTAAK